jgi:Transposase IS4
VKTSQELAMVKQDHGIANANEGKVELKHRTKVCVELIKSWFHSQRLVVADAFFSSVHTAETLMNIGLRFIGDVKTATKRSP